MNKNKATGVVITIIVVIVFFIITQGNRDNKKSVQINPDSASSTTDQAEQTAGGWPPLPGGDTILEDNFLKQNYYIIFDGSGSMKGDKLATAKKALKEFVNYVPADANLGLSAFDINGLSERIPLTLNHTLVADMIDSIQASGSTPLESAIAQAYAKINAQASRQLGYGEYNLVVITDGEASEGEDPRPVVNEILNESPVVIHTIGFQIGQNHSLNQPGKIYYKSANNLQELSAGLEEVLAEMESFTVTGFQE